MKLQDIASNGVTAPIQTIGGDAGLAAEVQLQLGAIGLLDPPADGKFGPVSHWALRQLLARLKTPNKIVIDADLASVLLSADPELFPLEPGDDFAGRVVQAALRQKYWLCRHPDAVNIVYIEGMDGDGEPNDDAPNVFNDLRLVLKFSRSGVPRIENSWEATTEPGDFYVKIKKLDPRGAAQVAYGQYKAWNVGTHMASNPKTAHEALVQVSAVKVFRDFNENFRRDDTDPPDAGVFGINQHWGYDLPKADVGKASAGCLVGRTKAGHRQFMELCKADPRYQASRGYQFMTIVMPSSQLD